MKDFYARIIKVQIILLIGLLLMPVLGHAWEPIGILPYGPFNQIVEAEGRVWIAGGGTVFGFDPEAGNAEAVDTIFVNGSRRGLAVNDGKLYLSTDANGVFTFDISERPVRQISHWLPPNGERLEDCVVLQDGSIAISSKTPQIFFLNATGDELINTYTDNGEGWFGNLAVLDDLLLAVRAPYPLQMMMIDVSNIAEPESLAVEGFRDWVYDFEPVNDTLCYVSAGSDGIYLVNLADPTSPEQLDHAPVMYGVSKAGPMSFDGETLLVSHQGSRNSPEGGLGIYSAALDSIRWFRWVGGDINAPLLRGHEAWVMKGMDGIYNVNLDDPQRPQINWLHRLPHQVEGVFVRDNLAYLAEGHGGLRIIDYSDPTAPREIGWCDNIGLMEDIWVDGDAAYVADGNGLLIYNVADPTQPEQIAHVTIEQFRTPWVEGVAVENGVLYAATHSKLVIGDVTDPSTPRGHSEIECELLKDLAVRDSIAFLADSELLRIYDCSNIDEPLWLSEVQLPGNGGWDVALRDTLALVSVRSFGLVVVSIADLEHPEIVGTLELENCQGLDDDGFFTYVGMVWDGLVAIDISDPTDPQIAEFYDTPGAVLNVKSDGRIVVAADYTAGTSYFLRPDLLSVSNHKIILQPAGFNMTISPNPFNASASLTFNVQQRAMVTIGLFDYLGRQIWQSSLGIRSPGVQAVPIDGSLLSSGSYFVQLLNTKQIQTEKIILIK